ncbi:hypothetical protein [Herbiconiux sp. YIM B11900]|uniref:hypothetical protein n=1 Tax=Herbiconiux sp. YIM B11900 TaxID=3404131 RepID=UPI003F85C2A8
MTTLFVAKSHLAWRIKNNSATFAVDFDSHDADAPLEHHTRIGLDELHGQQSGISTESISGNSAEKVQRVPELLTSLKASVDRDRDHPPPSPNSAIVPTALGTGGCPATRMAS